MTIESLLYRPLAILPAHAHALLEKMRLAEPAALLNSPRETERAEHYDLVNGVAIIPIKGVLVHTGFFWWGETSYNWIRCALAEAFADPRVTSIALHIDSPGGEVAGCFDLADDIFQSRGLKPMTAVVDEYACSAAYALASAADRIVVPRSGVVGSIGVISMHLDITQALEKAGLKVTTIQYGERKSDSYPTTVLSEEARKRMQADIDTLGEIFVSLVARHRGIDAAAVRATEAGVLLGEASVKAGLADAVAAADEAFEDLTQIPGESI